jgi:hypothetical protein
MVRSILAILVLGSTLAFGQETQPAGDAVPAQESVSLAVETIAVCKSVQDRTPVDEAESFASDVGSLACFVRVTGATSPAQTYHRWYAGETLVREIPIQVKGSPWRCWSVKSIPADWSGACRVDVVDEGGEVLASKSFTLTAAGSSSGAGSAQEEPAAGE